jgi:hexosaminidase
MADCLTKYTNVNNYALNPTLDETYSVIEKILTDIIATTGIKYFHLGGDEVVYGCWSNDASITSYMSKNGITSYDALLGMFVQRVDAIVRKLGATPVHWEEVFTAGAKVEPDTVFEVWTAQSKMAVLANANYTIISAPSDVWYLDSAANTWNKMYEYDPVSTLTASQKSLVLGGEVAMWGEHVDEHNIESIVYPRASSVGERLWSSASVNNSTLAKDRFLYQQCRLISRGFHPSSIEPGYCAKVPV